MYLSNRIRNISFWGLDFIKGGKIRKHYRNIEAILDNPTSKESLIQRNSHLDNVLKHATKTTAYYKPYSNFKSIEDFPVIKKNVIQEHFESFKSKGLKNNAYHKVSTSGSTGMPFFLYQDKNKRLRNTADVIFFSKLSNYIIGNRLFELEVWREHNRKKPFKSWLQNVIQFDITRLDEDRISHFLYQLKKYKQNKTLLGFASSFETICQYLDKKNITLGNNLKLTSIIANSEYLNDYTRTKLKQFFKVPVLSRYSNEEIGIIAQQTIESPNYFIINHASYFVEVLDIEKDVQVKKGQLGRIVVTDLFNYCMPIIRYDTGDVAKLIETEKGITKFKHIEGRKMDLIYDTSGSLISSFVIYTKFYKYYTYLKQYQFIQESKKEYTIKLNIHNTFPFETELTEDIKKDFGKDAIVKIVYVDEIPPLASGKRKKVVNNYTKPD
ncbi:CoF synthetase [Mariniflexile sp. HMF6888]|uniref:CoF synthetase n=1 Tax=Mariniflexile sp. HMF6888 TaxID=3373086 RepID=UPI00378C1F12